jgi:hypothetical protein
MSSDAGSNRAVSAIKYVEHKDFRKSLVDLWNLGGQPKKRADKVTALLGWIAVGREEPFSGLPLTNHGESRIKHCVKYDLGDGYRLITVKDGGYQLLCYVGTHSKCDEWIQGHSGLRLIADRALSWSVAYKSGSAPEEMIKREPSPARGRILERLRDELQDELLDGVPHRLSHRFYALDETATDRDVAELAQAIPDIKKSGLVYDVVCLLLAGDVTSAETRLDLEAGKIRSATELTAEEVLEVRDGEQVRRVPIGSREHADLLKRLSRELPHYDWLLFMHPEQQAVVDAEFSGAAQLSGVSGSGKTCVVVRRAVRLAQALSSSRVLILTLNRSLASLIAQLVGHAAPETIAGQIEVTSFFELCQRLLREYEPGNDKLYRDVTWKLGEHLDEVFREFYRCWNNNDDARILTPIHRSLTARGVGAETYLREEFDWIRSAVFDERSKYVDMNRVGRKFPLPAEWRQLAPTGLSGWERKMTAVGVVDYLGLTMAVSRHLEKMSPRYDFVLVDEAQDFGTTELSIVRKITRPGPNDLFLCGDIAQHVLPKHRVMADAGIEVSGRTKTIRRNYRNSREILKAAYAILVDNLDEALIDSGDLQLLAPELANRSSPLPCVLSADSLSSEIAYARAFVRNHLETYPFDRCCIAFAGYTLREVELYASRLGLPVLDGTSEPNNSPLVLSDLEQTKGYEFNTMVVVNCREGVLPPKDSPAEEALRHGCKLYVAMTRARDELYLSYTGTPSRWLTKATAHLSPMSWADVMTFDAKLMAGEPEHLNEVEQNATGRKVKQLNGREFVFTSNAAGLSLEAQEKLCELVDGIGLTRGSRALKWRSVADLARDLENSPSTRAAFGPKLHSEIRAALKHALG